MQATNYVGCNGVQLLQPMYIHVHACTIALLKITITLICYALDLFVTLFVVTL